MGSDLVLMCDEATITYVSPGGARVLGVAGPDSLIGRPVATLFPPEYGDDTGLFLEALSEETEPFPAKLKRGDGRSVDVELSTVATVLHGHRQFLLIGRDITDVVRSANTVVAGEKRYRSLVENALDYDPAVRHRRHGGLRQQGGVEAARRVSPLGGGRALAGLAAASRLRLPDRDPPWPRCSTNRRSFRCA